MINFKNRLPFSNKINTEALQAFVLKINEFPILSAKEEVLLFNDFKQGKSKSSEKLLKSQLRLVVSIAKKLLKNKKSNLWDLIQEGCIGLIEALDYFDPKRGRFATLASFHIRNKILRKIMQDASVVSIPESAGKRKAFHKLNSVKSEIGAFDNLDNNQVNQIKSKLNINKSDIIFMDQRMSQGDVSLNSFVNDDNETEKQDLLEDNSYENFHSIEDFLIHKIEGEKIKSTYISQLQNHIKNDLNDNERVIISRRKLKEKQDSLSEVGKSIGLTAERVRQIENSAIKKLRSKLISNLKLAS